MDKETLSIVCTNYNRKDLTKKWLENIERCWPKIQTELIMVDDCSIDGTKEFLREYAEQKKPFYGWQFILKLKETNTGFADTCAIGQRLATGQWILITQNDVEFSPGSIDAIIDTFKRLEKKITNLGCIGITGGLVDKNENLRLYDWSNWNGDGVVGYNQKMKFDYVQVDYLNGCLLLYRGDVAREKEIYFDSRYKFYWEDVDLCYQFNRTHKLVTIMVSMETNSIPHIHHVRNQTIIKLIPEYQQINDEMKEVFRRKWYE